MKLIDEFDSAEDEEILAHKLFEPKVASMLNKQLMSLIEKFADLPASDVFKDFWFFN